MLSVCDRRDQATLALEGHDAALAAEEVVQVLDAGIAQLRDAFVVRVHEDLEEEFGRDSMLAPPSWSREVEEVRGARNEVDAYSCFIVADQAARYAYVADPGDWLQPWALQIRFGDDIAFGLQRAGSYGQMTPRERHTFFVSLVHRVLPESRKAPAVLFHLFSRGVKIMAALAFGNSDRALALRKQQREMLTAIGECPECHGHLLEPDVQCATCGNPLWTYTWLRAD